MDKGLRRKVKDGDISVQDAEKWLDKRGVPQYADIRAWLKRRRRKGK